MHPDRPPDEGDLAAPDREGGQGRTGRGARRAASGPPGSREANAQARRRRTGDLQAAPPPEEEPATPLSDLDVMTAIWTTELSDGTGITLVRPDTRRMQSLYADGWTDVRVLEAVHVALQAGWALHDTEDCVVYKP